MTVIYGQMSLLIVNVFPIFDLISKIIVFIPLKIVIFGNSQLPVDHYFSCQSSAFKRHTDVFLVFEDRIPNFNFFNNVRIVLFSLIPNLIDFLKNIPNNVSPLQNSP